MRFSRLRSVVRLPTFSLRSRMLNGDWKTWSTSVRVQLISESGETHVLAQRLTWAQKEAATRTRVVCGVLHTTD
jgi:hypothetical protein